jgi:hypothetical protein
MNERTRKFLQFWYGGSWREEGGEGDKKKGKRKKQQQKQDYKGAKTTRKKRKNDWITPPFHLGEETPSDQNESEQSLLDQRGELFSTERSEGIEGSAHGQTNPFPHQKTRPYNLKPRRTFTLSEGEIARRKKFYRLGVQMMLALFSMIGLPLLFLIFVGPIPYVTPLIILASLIWFGCIMREAEVKI